ncbi:MAG: hypothetical protein QOE62_2829 [Actinomycetota bacterium]|nr:hypothetical protein [Actinomycetota bacterium]
MTIAHSHGPRRSRPCATGRPAGVSKLASEQRFRWVRVTCPSCGIVRVRTDRVVLRRCVDDQKWSYRARCSSCEVTFVESTPASLALPAIAAGVELELWSLPRPSARASGSALRSIDLLALHLALLEPDWFDQMASVKPGGDC